MASTNRDEISRLELLHAAHPDGLVFPHLADAYRRAGRYDQAESVLNAGLRRHADYSSAHVVLGRLRLDQGKRREAEDAFRHVLQLDPDNPVALQVLGRLAAEEGDPAEALAYLRKLATVKPSEELAAQIAELEHRARTQGTRRARPEDTVGEGAVRENGGGAGVERETDPANVPVPGLPEPGEVVTETMAELYARQGLHERAEAVYRELEGRDPDNARLRAKREEAAARRRGQQEGTSAVASSGRGGPRGRSGAAPTLRRQPIPGTSSTPGDPSIREYLTGVLQWSPAPTERRDRPPHGRVPRDHPDTGSRRVGAPDPPPSEVEPWAEAPVSRPPEDGGRKPVAPAPAASESEPWEPVSPAPVADPPDSTRPETRPPEVDFRESPMPGSAFEREWAVRRPAPAPRSRPAPTPIPLELGLIEDDLEGAGAKSRALIALADMLVGLLEYRDPFFRGSSSLTRLLATNVGRELGLKAADRANLALAAVLRDLGRAAMGGRLVDSQKTSRTPEARRKIERHVDLALHLMEGIELPRDVIRAVRHHHEWWDGAGYPDGLAGEEIPRLARVLAAVDSFAAMVSPRPYRPPRKVQDAASEMKEAAGTQYDPTVVDALFRVLDLKEQPHLGFVQRHHILLVNPDQPGAVVTAAKLCSSGYLAEVAVDPDAARERLRRVPVAALVVSAESGAEQAEDLVRELRIDPLFAALPIVVVDAESVTLRIRLLESGADVCFPPGISYPELQGTLGALVRRTLRSRETRPDEGGEAPWLALQGDIQDFPLAWLLQVMKYDSRTAGIGIRTATDQGAIYVENGDAVHAQIRGGTKGEAGLKEMLHWRKGRFTVQPDARARERTIDSSIMHLLLTQAVEEDHAAAGIFGAVSDHG